jgi:hypothetical protein
MNACADQLITQWSELASARSSLSRVDLYDLTQAVNPAALPDALLSQSDGTRVDSSHLSFAARLLLHMLSDSNSNNNNNNNNKSSSDAPLVGSDLTHHRLSSNRVHLNTISDSMSSITAALPKSLQDVNSSTLQSLGASLFGSAEGVKQLVKHNLHKATDAATSAAASHSSSNAHHPTSASNGNCMILFIVGGISPAELIELSAVAQCYPHFSLLFGSTRITTPATMMSQLLPQVESEALQTPSSAICKPHSGSATPR